LLIEPAKKYNEHGLVRKVGRVNIMIFNKFPNVPKAISTGGEMRFIHNTPAFKFAIRPLVVLDMIRKWNKQRQYKK
jgi:hypothetical protein